MRKTRLGVAMVLVILTLTAMTSVASAGPDDFILLGTAAAKITNWR